jgi:opacity protein-like surface antigen
MGEVLMSNRSIFNVVSLLLAAKLLLPNPASAQNMDDELLLGFDVNASVGFVIPTTDEYRSTLGWKLGAGYSLTEMFSLELGFGYHSITVDHDTDVPPDNTIADGDLKILPLVLTAQLRYPVPQAFGTVYALAGVGYYFIDYSWSGDSEDYFAQVDDFYKPPLFQEVEDSVGFSIGGGFDYPLSAHFVCNLEGQYVYLRPEANGAWRDLLRGDPHEFSGDLDLDSWIIRAGVRYLF